MSKRILVPAMLTLILAACSQSEKKQNPPEIIAGSPLVESEGSSMSRKEKKATAGFESIISSSAAVINPGDSLHRFVRTASLRFKVKEVIESTYAIEDFTASHDGYVEYTDLASTVNSKREYPISADSSMEITDFTVTNTMTIRVPVRKLDTLLKDIATTVEYLDYRIIKAKDVSLDLLSNELTQRRTERMQQRIGNSISASNGNATDKTTAAEALEQQEEAADAALIDNKRMEDKIQFATIKLELYQESEQSYRRIASVPPVDEYQPGFGTRLANALAFGWDIVLELLLVLARLWMFVLLVIIGIIWYRRRKKQLTVTSNTVQKS